MGHHLTDRGTFKSDKYDWCPEGFFALKLSDSAAQVCALLYAELTKEQELAKDLRVAVANERHPNVLAQPMDLEKVFEVVQRAMELSDVPREVVPIEAIEVLRRAVEELRK